MDDDLPPDLDRLRTLETWADLYLTRIRTRIAAVERQQARPPQQAPAPTAVPPSRPAAGPRPARPPDWGLAEAGIGVSVTEIHRGDCWASGKKLLPVTAERARAELAGGARACDACRPDRVLHGRDRP
ncbi:DUF6233 domain-containing protein [Streptomyces sp. NE06-03C]|uniref:DUF6233 domain-containing protein n=1 Tax=Streptomyces sp. NE06-03C TaxID=3028694 RepID=UPI0029BF3BB2|nr:DUF6233 domain-containing protein [Streptomyces sp. NE06-03C]MDX2922342.1 DUF6233 domain-containing protein [Streptomyces sp. NE06-03C]